jgi:hypothetical protein
LFVLKNKADFWKVHTEVNLLQLSPEDRPGSAGGFDAGLTSML